jgi:valyl-tRNA synthetase
VAGAAAARAALATALGVQLRLFAPFLPFVTEEVWAWWQEGSVHRSAWPMVDEVARVAQDGEAALVGEVAEVLSAVRKAKSDAKVGMRAEVARAGVLTTPETAARLAAAHDDLASAGRIADLRIDTGEPGIEVELAQGDPT